VRSGWCSKFNCGLSAGVEQALRVMIYICVFMIKSSIVARVGEGNERGHA